MAGWREKKRAMLGDVHKHFEIPAIYLTHATGTPVAVTVRLHRKQLVERPPLGTDDEVVAMLTTEDRIIFQKSQLPIVPEGVLSRSMVIFSPSEIYNTGPTKPERDGYIWCSVTGTTGQAEMQALVVAIQANPENYQAAFLEAFGDPLPAEWEGVFP